MQNESDLYERMQVNSTLYFVLNKYCPNIAMWTLSCELNRRKTSKMELLDEKYCPWPSINLVLCRTYVSLWSNSKALTKIQNCRYWPQVAMRTAKANMRIGIIGSYYFRKERGRRQILGFFTIWVGANVPTYEDGDVPKISARWDAFCFRQKSSLEILDKMWPWFTYFNRHINLINKEFEWF